MEPNQETIDLISRMSHGKSNKVDKLSKIHNRFPEITIIGMGSDSFVIKDGDTKIDYRYRRPRNSGELINHLISFRSQKLLEILVPDLFQYLHLVGLKNMIRKTEITEGIVLSPEISEDYEKANKAVQGYADIQTEIPCLPTIDPHPENFVQQNDGNIKYVDKTHPIWSRISKTDQDLIISKTPSSKIKKMETLISRLNELIAVKDILGQPPEKIDGKLAEFNLAQKRRIKKQAEYINKYFIEKILPNSSATL